MNPRAHTHKNMDQEIEADGDPRLQENQFELKLRRDEIHDTYHARHPIKLGIA